MRIITSIILLSVFAGMHSQDLEFPEVAGWNKSKKTLHYNADSLWTLIDGAADAFLQYDYEEMQRMEYWQNDSIYFEMHAYIYKNNESAFGIYSYERPADAKFNELGAQGYGDDNTINFLAGKYYVKMYTNTPSNEVKSAMRMVAYSLSKHMDAALALPAILKKFPEQNMIKNSEQLIAKDFLGHSFLKYVYQARYKEGENECYIFIIQKAEEEEVLSLISQFFGIMNKKAPENTDEIFKIKDPNNGTLFIRGKGNVLMGVYNVKDKKTAELLLK